MALEALECVITTSSDGTAYASSQARKVFILPIPCVIHFFHKIGWNGDS